MSARYRFAPGLELELSGPAGALRRYAREYGPAAVTANGTAPALRASVAWGGGADGHKTVRWSVRYGDADAEPLVLDLAVGGRPRSFGLSLVQGFHLEPALSVAAARRGFVLLPAAAVEDDGRAVVVLGRSRSGKSSVMTLALAAGRRVLGDDQVLLGDNGTCRAFPRRLRLYPDLRETAPAAFRALPPADRAALWARAAARAVSRGWVAPSLAVPASALGLGAPEGALPVERVVLVERVEGVDEAVCAPLDVEGAVGCALEVLDEQRARLAAAAGEAWRDALAVTREREADVLRAALAGARLERLRMPVGWAAARGIRALAGVVGLGA